MLDCSYRGLKYTYSGYGGTTSGKSGHEFIVIPGCAFIRSSFHFFFSSYSSPSISRTTNTRLRMLAYGFEAGVATVSYSYYER